MAEAQEPVRQSSSWSSSLLQYCSTAYYVQFCNIELVFYRARWIPRESSGWRHNWRPERGNTQSERAPLAVLPNSAAAQPGF